MDAIEVGTGERLLIASDLHLCEARPQTTTAFFAFLDGPARSADRVFILGDLFEYWPGDDDDGDLALSIAERLQACGRAGTRCHFLAGNRDFLLGDAYAARAGLGLLREPTELLVGAQKLLLMHGDTLCTDDHAYQAFRHQVRAPEWRAAFLARPLAERRAFIEGARRRSEAAKQTKAVEIMDANPDAVADAFRRHGYPVLIHGHTHRMATHRQPVDGRECQRWVLPEWHDRPRYLEWTAAGGRFVDLPPP